MLWDIMSRQRMNIFKGDSKKLPSGKTNFPFASISTSWNFWRKALFLGMSLSQLVPFIYFPRYVPIQRPQKRSTFCLFPPPEEVHQSTLCRWPRTSTCWHPKPRCFCWTTNNVVRPRPGGGGFPGGNKNGNFQGRWRKSENRWLSFFWVCFWCFCGLKVESYWKKNVKPGYTQDTPIVIVMNVLISFWFFSLKFPMLCVMANKIILENH